jgi:hypothetical protein
MTPLSQIPQLPGSLGRLGAGGRVVADDSWWLAGGVNPADVAAVWQPIGAASLAASYLRIAGSLGHANIDPALVGGVAPTFDGSSWIFNGTNQFLQTGVHAVMGYSMLVRFSGLSASKTLQCIAGTFIDSRYYLFPVYASGGLDRLYGAGGFVNATPIVTSGVMCVAGQQGYLNGVADGGLISTQPGNMGEIFIANLNRISTTTNQFANGRVQAIAIYTTTLTALQVALISAAMAALT